MKFHSMCRFRCPDGYFTDDELHDTKAYLGCLHNGTWNAQVPMNCVGKYFFFFFSFSLFGFFAFDARRKPSKLDAQFYFDHFPARVTLVIG